MIFSVDCLKERLSLHPTPVVPVIPLPFYCTWQTLNDLSTVLVERSQCLTICMQIELLVYGKIADWTLIDVLLRDNLAMVAQQVCLRRPQIELCRADAQPFRISSAVQPLHDEESVMVLPHFSDDPKLTGI